VASLAAYIVWAHGRGEVHGGALKGGGVEKLEKWFEDGNKGL